MGLNKYTLSFKSTPVCVTIEDESLAPRSIRRLYFSDSIFNFYPYSELYLIDNLGLISDKVFFVEGLEFETMFGSEEVTEADGTVSGGYIKNRYVWSENQINNIKSAEHLSGDNVFILTSKYKANDFPKSRAFNYETMVPKKTIGDIAKEIATTDFQIPLNSFNQPSVVNSNMFLSTATTGTPYIPQNNIKNRDFLKLLSEHAYTTNAENSPFFTFINTQGEFYFMSLKEMFNQAPIATYRLSFSLDMTTNQFIIGEYNILQGGMPVNRDNYKRNVFSLLPAGTTNNEVVNIHDKTLMINSNDKYLIRRQYITDITDNKYFGVYETEDLELYKGYINSLYNNSDLSYRLIIVVHFNPKAVAGKVVNLNFEKANDEGQIAQEYSGNWLIISSEHYSDQDWTPYTQLTISKQGISVDRDHAFINDFGA